MIDILVDVKLIDFIVDIVFVYVSNNMVVFIDLLGLINEVYGVL